MKFLLALFAVSSLSAYAADTCSTIWIYKDYKACAAPGNGPDKTKPPTIKSDDFATDWVKGGKEQNMLCANLRNAVENQNPGAVVTLVSPTPVKETDNGNRAYLRYKYWCRISVATHPDKVAPNKACGSEDKWKQDSGEKERPMNSECLSCDDYASESIPSMVECLRANIKEVVEPKAVELRDTDIAGMKKQVQRLQKIAPSMSSSLNEAEFWSNFLEGK